MTISVSASPKRIKGYDSLHKLDGCYYDGVSSHIIHLTFNLKSVSFAVMMVPTTRQQWWGDGNICFLKIRCEYASVYYDTYGYCYPKLNEIRISDGDNGVIVEIKDYATIVCDRVVAKVETVAATNPDLPTVLRW